MIALAAATATALLTVIVGSVVAVLTAPDDLFDVFPEVD